MDILRLPHFSVTTPAADLSLLTQEELRAAAGLDPTDTSQDTTLAQYEAEVAAEIMSDCAIASDGVNPPTLRSEECTDVFRLGYSSGALFLSRHHVSAISDVLENGTTLTPADWLLDAETGKLVRLLNNASSCWSTLVEVSYTAGFDTVPNELKAEARARIKIKSSEGSRDPLARSIQTTIPDVESRQIDYQVGGLSRLMDEGLAPESVRRLRRFMTQSMVG